MKENKEGSKTFQAAVQSAMASVSAACGRSFDRLAV